MKAYENGRDAVAAVVSHVRKPRFAAGLHGDWSAGSIGFRRACPSADADCGGGYR